MSGSDDMNWSPYWHEDEDSLGLDYRERIMYNALTYEWQTFDRFKPRTCSALESKQYTGALIRLRGKGLVESGVAYSKYGDRKGSTAWRRKVDKGMGVGKAKYLEARIRMLEEELANELDKVEQWGWIADTQDGEVISWEEKYDNSLISYTFVAIKCVGHWYTSSMYQRVRLTDGQLVDKHLEKAVEGSIYRVAKWEPMP